MQRMPAMNQKSPCLWTLLPQGSPAPCDRYKHASCTYNGDVYVLGGRDSSCLKDLWRYTVALNEWTKLVCNGEAAPDELEEHSMVAHEGFLYVFGGMLDSAYTERRCPLWVFDITKQKWMQWQGKKSSPQVPTNRKGHSAVVFGSAMFMYGGYIDMRGSSQEFWTLDFDTMAWSLLDSSQQVSMGPGPGPRHSHSAVTYQDCMYLFGGLRGLREQKDLWVWNSTSHTWSCLKAMSGPSKLVGHSAVVYKDSMLVFGGGESQSCPMNSLWRFSFPTLTWERLAMLPGSNPPPRIHHCCIGLGPSYQSQISPSYSVSYGASSRPRTGLMDTNFKPFKNKCFPLPLTYLGTEDGIELETFSPDKSGRVKSYTDLAGPDDSNGSLRGKEIQQIGSCLTFKNQAFSKKWSNEEDDMVDTEEEENSITQHLPDLLLVLGGKPLNRHAPISVWQMTLTES